MSDRKKDDLSSENIYSYPSLLDCVACAPKDVSVKDVEAHVRTTEPCGTSMGWRLNEDTEPVVCDDDPDRLHHLLDC